LGPSVAQQEKEFQRAVQPGSPISSLISSAKQPLLVSHDSKPSLLRKLNSTRAQPTDLVRRERDRIHASPMPAVGEEAAGEGEETGTNAEAEARAREELAEQKARIVAEMAGGSTLAVEPKEGSQRQEQPPGAALHGRPRPLARVENTSRPAGGSGVSSSRQGLKPPQDVEKPMGLPATRHLTGKERATLPAETRSTAHEVSMRPAGMFDAFSQNLAEALEAWDAGRLFPQHGSFFPSSAQSSMRTLNQVHLCSRPAKSPSPAGGFHCLVARLLQQVRHGLHPQQWLIRCSLQ
jgi:cell cycle serine/threonine-protein kinase CDC5/MSD2